MLTRKAGQSIRVGDSILFTIVEVGRGGQVKVAIEAPRDVDVMRTEIEAQYARPITTDGLIMPPAEGAKS